MAVQTIVLYGSRLYDAETYSTNEDPESLTATLSDSMAIQDTGFQFLADAIAMLEAAITTDGIKALADSLSMTESQLIAATKILVDSIDVQDASVQLQQIKGLSDFILVKDWVELQLLRAGVWSESPAYGFRPSNIHLYGPGVYYGFDFYSSNPTVAWLIATPATTTWEMSPAVGASLPLYSQTQYGSQPYSGTPAVGWTKPISNARQNWTNENGESHN